MTWSRFSLAVPHDDSPTALSVRYGPGIPAEDSLKLLGPLSGKRVLELGCGAGSISVALAQAGAKVIAVDESAEALAQARAAAGRNDVHLELHQSPLAEFAFVRADTVDVALSVYGLAATEDIDRVFRQVHRVLRPERPFVFSLPHPAFNLLNPTDDEPRLRRRWWDPSALPWSRGVQGGDPDQPRTLAGIVSSLGRANFRVDTVAEPRADETAAGSLWSEQMEWVPPTLIIRARKVGL